MRKTLIQAFGIWALLISWSATLRAADLPDVTMHGVASGEALKIGFEGRGKHVLPETIYLHGGRTRVEFQTSDQQGYVLRDGKSAWLINEKAKVAWPLQYSTTARQFVFELAKPCINMAGSCERTSTKQIAGRSVTGWHFKHAGTSGPDGTDSGTLWIDDEYGLLLSYQAEDMQGRSMGWNVSTVTFETLPTDLFMLPDTNMRSRK
jgi:outer membrane lipoprotein-sorting protein